MSKLTIQNLPVSGDPDRLTISRGKNGKRVRGKVTIHGFKDHDHFISYIPTLNLSAYGSTDNEARERLLKVVLDDYFHEITKLSADQITAELKSLGWDHNKLFDKKF